MKLCSMSAYFSGKLETNDEIGFWVRRSSHPTDRADETEIIEPSMPNRRTYASERPAGNDDAQQMIMNGSLTRLLCRDWSDTTLTLKNESHRVAFWRRSVSVLLQAIFISPCRPDLGSPHSIGSVYAAILVLSKQCRVHVVARSNYDVLKSKVGSSGTTLLASNQWPTTCHRFASRMQGLDLKSSKFGDHHGLVFDGGKSEFESRRTPCPLTCSTIMPTQSTRHVKKQQSPA